MSHATCPHCGKEITPRPVGRPRGSRRTSKPVADAVDAVLSGKMGIVAAAAHFGVSRAAIDAARKKRLTTE